MSYLLGVTVGPIQINIQKSRKLRELYNSSKIVSDMMKKVIEYLKIRDETLKIIYPSIKDVNDTKTDITNYLICEINNIDDLKDMRERVFDELKISVLEEIYFMFWTVEPLEEYSKTYKKLTKKLRSIKNTYEFKNYEKDVRIKKKCSLCGERITEDASKLCEVCNCKRNYNQTSNWKNNNKGEKYKSVYDISIDVWKEKYNEDLLSLNKNLEDLFNNTSRYYSLDTVSNIIKCLKIDPKKVRKEKEIDEDLENPKMESIELIAELKNIRCELESIYLRGEKPVSKPHYKYCFIQIDVDDLGKWISGEYNYEEEDLKESQIQISKALCSFAYKLKEEFKNSKTKVIYAGGDDFLAVLPVECLLNTLKIIEEIFKSTVQNDIDNSLNYSQKISYSASVTIANCKDEMALALRKNREALEKVKNRYYSKNGICINYIINTSKIIDMFLSKDYFNEYVDNLRYFKKVEKYISFTYVDAIENEFNKMKFEDLKTDDFLNIKDMLLLEFERHLNLNKNKVPKDNKEGNENFLEYFKIHTRLFENIINDNEIDEKIDFINIINCFRIYKKLTDFQFKEEAKWDEVSKN
ncbi:type III-B CRISPR-associated protein Cas10/Cmr2 [Clostridium botulinum]|uniref:type III-B CRISPR-associated protein Cas10/Cmr2 n=1 Tax=Clostridium botulinum TaxID=1491 RepID=UPI0001F851C4|nr:type III-B CRISPR-associated protein Cas10/Cmr2 [Clostridium botulinum]KEI92498.1 CRISPR-associated protein Crm2 [Clostridium botulinum B2 275]NFB16469.1 type III-B CRISPR-associated protein Cas10/Cmr2 [Clostridium botulinum]NFB68245.1 type III-B CRISPR-associated protein Cas10/Cmr2 [Clostridium botulinum]NFB96555.1 type III-B CRISPR-associated protein Cas10/Cmr2 [Clostridium botulinum]NFC46335.1 type III-B CRISPR-associated protein Cas10/Cmr2 [Clostridium botulinum]